MAVRSIEHGEAAAKKLRDLYPSTKIDVWELDMLSYSSIQAFAQRCYALPNLDVAILNAGLGGSAVSQINAPTGHEETFQVNYLSTALLSVLLLPVLRAKTPSAQPGRLTVVGSGTALLANFENRNAVPLIPSFDQPFSGVQAGIERYGTSKLLVKMLIQKLAENVSADDVIINTVEPGLTNDTGLHRNFSKSGKAMMAVMKKLKSRTPEQAAWTYIDAVAAKGRESHGGFIMFWEVWA
jgi:NAD(P)-dependent dehydrogenase (short-subunit alcohol dehydrogenase family)